MKPGIDCVAPLFVPGHRPERFDKAVASGTDAVIIDLEDAVPADAKDVARASLPVNLTCPLIVRINGADTPWHHADLAAVSALPIAAILVPKCEANGALDALLGRADGPAIMALIETARGISQARLIASAPAVRRLVFGSVDYCADIGSAHARESLVTARCELVLASRLAGLPSPVDGVTTTLDNEAEIDADTRHARTLGFAGKLCIHPRQVASVLAGFRPSESEVGWAKRVLASEDGAVVVDGAMVDKPVRMRARAILERSGG